VGFVSASSSAFGQGAFVTGNQLYEDCSNTTSETQQGYCLGFITGVWETNRQFQNFTPKYICINTAVSATQLKDVVMKYLGERPSLRRYSAESLTRAALRAAFPCPP
jgi:hypothetical protein